MHCRLDDGLNTASDSPIDRLPESHVCFEKPKEVGKCAVTTCYTGNNGVLKTPDGAKQTVMGYKQVKVCDEATSGNYSCCNATGTCLVQPLQESTECDKGWYGDGCQRQCGHCINITQCNYVHGTCSQGCEMGYEGQTCDRECQDGYFGENCARKCPANCHSCNKKYGLCDLGCHPGWKGTHCTESMYRDNSSGYCGII
uniref:Cell death abnormality protein 1 n=1 Tax=Magallana gigas TaxID=29159 RepID=K1RAA7_MAGGI